MDKTLIRSLSPLLIIFIVSNSFFLFGQSLLGKWNIDADVVMICNILLVIATAVSFYMYYKALRNNNVQGFLRLIYAGMFIKMMICLFSGFLYIMISGKTVNKGGIIVCLGLYLLYSAVEVGMLLKQSKQRKNA